MKTIAANDECFLTPRERMEQLLDEILLFKKRSH